jgi:hypothetical protein
MGKILNALDLAESKCCSCKFLNQDCLMVYFPGDNPGITGGYRGDMKPVWFHSFQKQFTTQEVKDMVCHGFREPDPDIDPEMDYD